MIERRRLPSSSYYSPSDDECWSRDFFAEQPIAILAKHRDASQVARHVANQQVNTMPFFVMDIPAVVARLDEWRSRLPRLQAHFALLCNPDPVLARLLADCSDMGFEVSNNQELEMAMELVTPDRIIYNNPLWTRKAMRLAGEFNVGTVLVENEKQLMDAVSFAPEARILLNVVLGISQLTEPSLASPRGCNINVAESLIMTAFELRANLVGISFDLAIGIEPCMYYKALREVRQLFDFAIRCGLHVNTIGVGGGFPTNGFGGGAAVFSEICDVINTAIDHLFPCREFPRLKVVASPGRYFAAAAFVLCTNVIGKQTLEARFITKDDYDDGIGFVYQTNDGVYGSFRCRLLDSHPQCIPLHEPSEGDDDSMHFATVLGPSLDGIDVAQSLVQCRQLRVGEWLLWENMGAYSIPLMPDHSVPPVYYYAGKDNWERIIGKARAGAESSIGLLSHISDSASDGSSDIESIDDEDNLAECFDRVFYFGF